VSVPVSRSTIRPAGRGRLSVAYGGLLLFTVLLYLRPNDWLPIGTFPIAKIVALVALVAFFAEQVSDSRPFSVLPREFKYVLALTALMIVSMPFGLDPATSFGGFMDEFLKVLLIFILTINVLTSLQRLRRLMETTVVCGTIVAVGTLGRFVAGQNLAEGFRAGGAVGGIFGGPNELALALNVLLPITIGLALSNRNLLVRLLYGACAACQVYAALITYSRAGFLTLVAVTGFLLVKLGRRSPMLWAVVLVGVAVILMLAPGEFWNRTLTIFDTSGDASAAQSAETRWALIKRSLEVMGFNPIRWTLGVGMYNFHIVSVSEYGNHNSYLQVFNEVGLPALIMYLAFLVGVIRVSGQIANACAGLPGYRNVWMMAVAIQGSLVAYAVGSFFAHVAYLWYLYYVAGFAVCLKMLVLSRLRKANPTEVPRRVWNLRRIRY
jgi:putative inorganic carbon (HCO3(-)) transporter